MTDVDFVNRTVLVTGGSRGIGRACCERLAKAGANVVINYHSHQEDALETNQRVEASGAKGMVIQADVTDQQSVAAMINSAQDHFGTIDMLVNNAGIFEYLAPEKLTLDHWKRMIDVNLTGSYIVTWAVKEQMVQQEFGRIVNVSSISALSPRPNGIAYAVSKAGLIAFTQSASAALISHNIRMNAVAPGLVDTEINAGVDQTVLDRIIDQTPMNRMGRTNEIADVVYFLLSERSRFMMGQTVVASGGRAMLP